MSQNIKEKLLIAQKDWLKADQTCLDLSEKLAREEIRLSTALGLPNNPEDSDSYRRKKIFKQDLSKAQNERRAAHKIMINIMRDNFPKELEKLFETYSNPKNLIEALAFYNVEILGNISEEKSDKKSE